MNLADAIQTRWSPREFTPRALDKRLLEEIFLAVRMAQSSFNEQPWRYLIAMKTDQPLRDQLEGLLVEGNAFAREAAVLGISFARLTFTRNQKPNRVAWHDLGAANQILALKAFDLGLNTRFMAGFDADKAKAFAPPEFTPVAMFVIGHAAEKALQAGPENRHRKALADFVFGSSWGRSFF